jgi:hypothetical protein
MGEHDQTVLHDKDAHASIHDDGRALRPAGLYDPEVAAEDDGHSNIHFRDEVMPGPRLRITPVFRYSSDKLISDALHVHLRPFSITKWESIYSTVFGSGTHPNDWVCPSCDPGLAPSFTPVIDESYRVVGHLGWISGTEICVPKGTVAWDSPVAHIFEERRLGEDRQRTLWRYDHPIQHFSMPLQPARDAWEPSFIASLRKGPLKDASEEQRHLNNINYFLAGGGTALVGRDYVHDKMASQNFEPFLPGDYRCMALVNPDGNLQGVLSVEKIHHESRQDRGLRIIFEVIDIALTIWMIIDIATISVVLIRLGARLAGHIEIKALEMGANQAAKAGLKAAEREAKAALDLTMQRVRRELGGAMTGPELAERKTAWQKLKQDFWNAGKVPPRKQFSKDLAKEWNDKIANRMRELGIPKKNQGAGVRRIPPPGEKPPPGGSKKLPVEDENGKAFNETGSTRGGNYRSSPADRYGGEERGISVHGNVFDRWEGFDLWNDPTTTDWDRIDAIIAHEWSEFNGLTHWETVELMPETKLAISPRARELSRHMMRMGGEPEMAFTEFTKAEWNAIKAAGKQNAPFKEKMAAAAAAKAR